MTDYFTAWMHPDFDPYSSAPAIGVPDFGPPPDVPIAVLTALVTEPDVPTHSGDESAPVTEES